MKRKFADWMVSGFVDKIKTWHSFFLGTVIGFLPKPWFFVGMSLVAFLLAVSMWSIQYSFSCKMRDFSKTINEAIDSAIQQQEKRE